MANSGRREWNVKLIDTRTKRFVNDDTGVFQVYNDGAATRPSIWDATGAVATQEVVGTSFLSQTMTDGTLKFWTARSVSIVDVSILTAGGRSYFLDGLKSKEHRVDVDPHQTEYVLTVALNDQASSTTVRPLGFQLRRGMVLKEVLVDVKAAFTGAAAASSTYDLGTSGDPNGFLDAIQLSAVGVKQATPVSSTGIAAAQIRGAKLVNYMTQGASGGHFAAILYAAQGTITGLASNNLVAQRAVALTASFTASKASNGRAYVYYMYTLLPGSGQATTIG